MNKKPRILIVEDERIIALETRRKLESMGYSVSAIVSSGEEAIKKSAELQPDLVLMDIILQGEMDGVEAASQIRTRFGIPIVYVTANVSDARLEDITRSEPFGYLFKPFEDIELQTAVKMALYKYRMEKKLRESEETFRILAETTPVAVMVYQGSKWVYANSAACEICGYSKEEILSMNYWDFVRPDCLELIKERGQQRQENTLDIPRYDFKIITKSGKERWVDLSGGTLTKYKGKPAGIISVVDITGRVKTEDELRKSEERYRAILTNIEDGYFEVDLAGKLTFFNESMCRIAAASSEKLMGMDFRDYTTPETAKDLLKAFSEVYTTGQPAEIRDYEIIGMDGKQRDLELSVALVRNKEGEPTGFRGMARDVTQRIQTEDKLRESEERYRQIIEKANDIIYRTDENGYFTFANHITTRTIGCSEEEYIGKHFLELIRPDYRDEAAKYYGLQFVKKIKNTYCEYPIVRKDGTELWIGQNVQLIMENDRIKGFQAVARDVTARRQAEEGLQKAKKEAEDANQKLEYLSYMDELTDIANRRYFEENFDQEWNRAMRHSRSLALVMIDIDLFKNYNDTYGHKEGDVCLRKVATALKHTLKRPGDFVARYGGEEFIAVLPDTDITGAAVIAESMRMGVQSLETRHDGNPAAWKVTISLGVASTIPESGQITSDTLVIEADNAMYRAKQGGRNRVEVQR